MYMQKEETGRKVFQLKKGKTYLIILGRKHHALLKLKGAGVKPELIVFPGPGDCITDGFHAIGYSDPGGASITAQIVPTGGGDPIDGQPSPQQGYFWDFEFDGVAVGDYTLTVSGGTVADQEDITVQLSCQ